MTPRPIQVEILHGAEARTAPERLSDGTEDLSSTAMLVQRIGKRENVRMKAARMLVSGRLRVVKVDGDLIIAECRGDSGEVYKLGYRPDQKRWGCTCQARTACSHQHALWAVVALERS